MSLSLAALLLATGCTPTIESAGGSFLDKYAYELRALPAGSHRMGSDDSEEGRRDNEGPRHKVRLTRGVLMGSTEVTQSLYLGVMGSNPSNFTDRASTKPVEEVSWLDAAHFCNALSELEGLQPAYELGEAEAGDTVRWDPQAGGYRLPTEAEWEYAARAGTSTLYAGSDDLDLVAWHVDNARRKTHPVGEKQPNAWGLYDMSGNVWEWTWDWKAPYEGAATDPSGPQEGSHRVLRGGSWIYPARYARVAYRNAYPQDFHNDNLGFRIARNP